jgi:succinate dehydrogenase / fumarate reductase flavoprotein subunit
VDAGQVDEAARVALEPFGRAGNGAEGPYHVQHDLQAMMQDLVGIVRREDEMRRALDGIEALKARAERVSVAGHREYNPGWHTALDLANLLVVSEAVARAAVERRESRGGHFRDDYPAKDPAFGAFNVVLRREPDGAMRVERRPIAPMPEDLQAIVAEMG